VRAQTYLDYNATAKVRPEASAAALAAMAQAGNPSSVHADGRAARALIEDARAEVAGLVGARAGAVTFVSGGTEANALGIKSAVAAGFERLIVGATEHEAVARAAQAAGLAVETWPVNGDGLADLDWLEARLAAGGPVLVCLMLANNETGVIQPVATAAAMVRGSGGWLHVDAVQAAGKIAVDFNALGAHTLALSAHKLGGPQGAGALVAASDASLTPSLRGGGQERGLRAGTENTPGIASFGAAARAAVRDLAEITGQAEWRDALAASATAFGATVLGAGAPRLPQTLCFATPGFSSEVQVMALDLEGVMVSAGAACSSGKVTPSGSASAMGRPDLARFAVRVSGGWASSRADWRRCGEVWCEAFDRAVARRREVA
jgi:cysteine desulfurase